MSTLLKTITSEIDTTSQTLSVIRFSGGFKEGACIQLSLSQEHIQLTKAQVRELVCALHNYLCEIR
jgi:hypothetical protein